MSERKYRILQTITDLSARSGGTSTATRDLMRAISRQNADVRLVTLGCRNNHETMVVENEEWLTVLPNDYKTAFAYSRNLRNYLNDNEFDLYHANALWQYPTHQTSLVARKRKKPYMITTHGMLNPLALKRSYWKKYPIMKLGYEKDIMEASCLHATCKAEMEDIRQFGYLGPIAVIANPIPANPLSANFYNFKRNSFLKKGNPIIFGFLGRLHPVKRVENILYGLSQLGSMTEGCELWIIGKGDNEYENFLLKEVNRLSLKNVKFLGFVNGDRKYELLSQMSALFVPSDFENFGMIVTEALSVGTPVMASLGTPWEELNTEKCGWWIDKSPENIAHVMKTIIEMPTEDLLNMGINGMKLVYEKYNADKIAHDMISLYDWLIHGGGAPSFVCNL